MASVPGKRATAKMICVTDPPRNLVRNAGDIFEKINRSLVRLGTYVISNLTWFHRFGQNAIRLTLGKRPTPQPVKTDFSSSSSSPC